MKKFLHNESTIWKYQADSSAWYFITLPKQVSQEIREFPHKKKKGWGSRRVEINIGESIWQTSIFPDKRHGYVLPIKASIRKKEALDEGDVVTYSFTLIEENG